MKKTGISLKNRGSAKTRTEAEEKDVSYDLTMCEGQQSKDISHSHSFGKKKKSQRYRNDQNITKSQVQGQMNK